MGLPASGKSTFVKKQLSAFFPRIPNIQDFQTLSSDSQLKALQFKRAEKDYSMLKELDRLGYEASIQNLKYTTADGKEISFELPYDSFTKMGFKQFFSDMYKKYYASYFGERTKATQDTEALADKKIAKGDTVVLDSTGQNYAKWLKLFEKTKAKGYTNAIVFLEISVDYAVARDTYRGETEGRSVGKKSIEEIAAKLPTAYNKLKESPLVDRYMRFKWVGELIKGSYKLIEEKKKYPYK